jgi:hypothetical protein
MSEYRELVKIAMQAKSEKNREEAAQLFERMLEDVNSGRFSDFEDFADLANFLSEVTWPEQGKFQASYLQNMKSEQSIGFGAIQDFSPLFLNS